MIKVNSAIRNCVVRYGKSVQLTIGLKREVILYLIASLDLAVKKVKSVKPLKL